MMYITVEGLPRSDSNVYSCFWDTIFRVSIDPRMEDPVLIVLFILSAEDPLVEGVEPMMETSEFFREEKSFLECKTKGSMNLILKVSLDPYAKGCSL